MAILHVAQMGHPVLRLVAEPVDPALIPTPEMQGFLEDMLDTMEEYDGAGLAAPQVHVSQRIVCLVLDDERGPEFWINPVITPLTDRTMRTYEGCLSVDGMRGAVDRPARIRVEFLDRTGTPRAYELAGFPAVVAQHECDHLDGVLYIDKVDPTTLAFLKEYRRFGPLDRFFESLREEAEQDADEEEVEEVEEELSLDDLAAMAEELDDDEIVEIPPAAVG